MLDVDFMFLCDAVNDMSSLGYGSDIIILTFVSALPSELPFTMPALRFGTRLKSLWSSHGGKPVALTTTNMPREVLRGFVPGRLGAATSKYENSEYEEEEERRKKEEEEERNRRLQSSRDSQTHAIQLKANEESLRQSSQSQSQSQSQIYNPTERSPSPHPSSPTTIHIYPHPSSPPTVIIHPSSPYDSKEVESWMENGGRTNPSPLPAQVWGLPPSAVNPSSPIHNPSPTSHHPSRVPNNPNRDARSPPPQFTTSEYTYRLSPDNHEYTRSVPDYGAYRSPQIRDATQKWSPPQSQYSSSETGHSHGNETQKNSQAYTRSSHSQSYDRQHEQHARYNSPPLTTHHQYEEHKETISNNYSENRQRQSPPPITQYNTYMTSHSSPSSSNRIDKPYNPDLYYPNVDITRQSPHEPNISHLTHTIGSPTRSTIHPAFTPLPSTSSYIPNSSPPSPSAPAPAVIPRRLFDILELLNQAKVPGNLPMPDWPYRKDIILKELTEQMTNMHGNYQHLFTTIRHKVSDSMIDVHSNRDHITFSVSFHCVVGRSQCLKC